MNIQGVTLFTTMAGTNWRIRAYPWDAGGEDGMITRLDLEWSDGRMWHTDTSWQEEKKRPIPQSISDWYAMHKRVAS